MFHLVEVIVDMFVCRFFLLTCLKEPETGYYCLPTHRIDATLSNYCFMIFF